MAGRGQHRLVRTCSGTWAGGLSCPQPDQPWCRSRAPGKGPDGLSEPPASIRACTAYFASPCSVPVCNMQMLLPILQEAVGSGTGEPGRYR